MRRLVPVAALMILGLMTACGDDSEGSGGSGSTATTSTTTQGTGGSGTTSTTSTETGTGGMGQGGEGQGGAGGSTGGLPFGSQCAVDADCESGLCFDFNAQGPHCTVPCPNGDADCTPYVQSSGCNGMGVCKTQ